MGKLLSVVVTNNHIRIAELTNKRKSVTVSRLLTQRVPEGLVADGTILDVRAFAEFLTSTLRYANIKTKRLICSLPSDRIMTREIILPELEEEKLKAALQLNAPEYFPVDLTDYVLGYFPISRILEDEVNGREEEDPVDGEGAGDPDEGRSELSRESGESKRKRSRKSKIIKRKDKERNKGKHKRQSTPRIGRRRKKETKLRLMAVAAPNEMVQSYFDMAKLAHLKLLAVDYLGNSVFQLTANQIGEEPSLVIQLDEDHTVLSIYQNSVMMLQRHVDFGISSLIQAVMEKEDLGYERARELLEKKPLIHENFDDGDEITDTLYYPISNIRRVIEYYAGRNADQPLEQVYLMGDGSRLAGLELLFENQLNLPVELITALKQVAIKQNEGLSVKEALQYMDNIGAVLDPINLIPKQLEQDMRRKVEAKAYRVMILLSLFFSLIIMTVPATQFLSESMEVIDLKNKLLVMEDVKPILNAYNQASSRYADVRKVQSLVRTNNESLSKFIRIFEQLRPGNITIQSFSCDEGTVSFTALAQGKKTVAKLILQLNTIANVSEVKVSALSSQFDGEKETVAFSLVCNLTNEDALLLGGEEEDQEAAPFSLEGQTQEDEVTERMNEIYEQMEAQSADAADGIQEQAIEENEEGRGLSQ